MTILLRWHPQEKENLKCAQDYEIGSFLVKIGSYVLQKKVLKNEQVPTEREGWENLNPIIFSLWGSITVQ